MAAKRTLLPGMFDDPNPDKIVAAMQTLLEVQRERVQDALDNEDPAKPKPATTNMMNSLFNNTAKFAKMVAPARFSPGAKVAINVGTPIEGKSPQRVVSEIVQHFVELGVREDEITSDMIEMLLRQRTQPVIDLPALEAGDDDDES
jgi:hypothetical protein